MSYFTVTDRAHSSIFQPSSRRSSHAHPPEPRYSITRSIVLLGQHTATTSQSHQPVSDDCRMEYDKQYRHHCRLYSVCARFCMTSRPTIRAVTRRCACEGVGGTLTPQTGLSGALPHHSTVPWTTDLLVSYCGILECEQMMKVYCDPREM